MRQILAVLVLCSACAAGQHAPLSAKLLTAKSVFIQSDGPARVADSAYSEITKWGRFQVVDSPANADIVFSFAVDTGQSLHGTTGSYNPAGNNGYGGWQYGHVHAHAACSVRLSVIEPTTGYSLYSDSHGCGFHGATRSLLDSLRKRMAEQEKK